MSGKSAEKIYPSSNMAPISKETISNFVPSPSRWVQLTIAHASARGEEEFFLKKKQTNICTEFLDNKNFSQARSQDFCLGGEGGRGCVPREPGPNILMFEWYAMQVPKIHRAEWRTYGVIEIGTSFNATGKTCKRRRREPLGGSGGMPPSSPPERCHKMWHIFIIKNYRLTPLSFNARKIPY